MDLNDFPHLGRLAARFPWADAARACPLADLRDAEADRAATDGPCDDAAAWMSAGTLALLLANLNPADLWGRRTTSVGCERVGLNEILAGDGLPPARVWGLPDGLVAVGPEGGPRVLLDVGAAG